MLDLVDIERGELGGMPYAAVGSGRPLVVLAGLMPTTGVAGDWVVRSTIGPLSALTANRRIIVLNRRPMLPSGMTMRQLADEHADALDEASDGTPVDVVGTSTGGSIAQQLAADRPDVVRRLALVSSACRLGPEGRRLQAEVASLVREGRTRQALAVVAAGLVPRWRGRTAARLAGYLIGPALARDAQGVADMATTIEAEDAFDLASCPTVRAPTLLVGGARDRFYPPALFEETARLVPGAHLRIAARRGHLTVLSDRRCRATLLGFLQAGDTA